MHVSGILAWLAEARILLARKDAVSAAVRRTPEGSRGGSPSASPVRPRGIHRGLRSFACSASSCTECFSCVT